MVYKKILTSSIAELTDNGYFLIKRIDYDENNFGNFCIELTTNNQINVRFIQDRGVFWCEVGSNNEWYFIEDVLNLIEVVNIDKKDEVIEFLKYMSKILLKYISKIFDVFDAENFEESKLKIEKISTERVMKIFKI